MSRADTIPKQRQFLGLQINQFRTKMDVFKRVYRPRFICQKERGQNALPLENAIVVWQLIFYTPGQQWTTRKEDDWCKLWIRFLNETWTKSVNKDMWDQTFEFYLKSLADDSLTFWSEDGAWPAVIDDFVLYVKEKWQPVYSPEKMETD